MKDLKNKFKHFLFFFYENFHQKIFPLLQSHIKTCYDFIIEKWKKKYIKIGLVSVISLMTMAMALPAIVLFFTPLTEKGKLRLAKIEKKITTAQNKSKNRQEEYEKLKESNREIKKTIFDRNAKILTIKIHLFQMAKGRYPTEKEIKRVLYPVLIEPFSYSKQISFELNQTGGWYYDAKKGKIRQNFRPD